MEGSVVKYIVILAMSLAFSSSTVFAKTSSRDVLIGQVEAAYTQAMILTPDSPLFDLYLAEAKSANPGVSSATWSEIKRDLSPAVTKVLIEQGGMVDVALRQSMESLSDDELQKLNVIFVDPTYKRFQAAMASPATQQQMLQSIMASAPKMNAVVDKVLAMHGLKVTPSP
jgi:hypothetical protein